MKLNRITIIAAALITSLCLCSCAPLDVLKGAGGTIAGLFSEEPEQTETADNTTETETETAVTNDITIGVYDFDTYDPLNTSSATVKDLCGFIFEPLFSLDSSMRTIPVLADSYDVSTDGMSVTIYLKQGVLWHDGSEFTANDVVYTINRIKSGTANYGGLMEPVVSAKASDSYTVIVSFSRPVPDAASLFIFPIVKSGAQFTNSRDDIPTGTGPFKMAGQVSPDRYRLDAFDGHHDTCAVLDCVYVSFIPDKEKFISLFNASEINLANSDILDMTSFMPKGNAQVQDFISNNMTFLGFNTRIAKLSDPRTRQAISMLIDRESIVTHIYFSRAEAAQYAINPQSWLNFDTRDKLRADSAGASMLLREAGWEPNEDGIYSMQQGGNTLTLRLEIIVNSDSPQRVQTAEEIRDRLRTAGIDAYVTQCSYTEYTQRVGSGNFELFIGETELLPNNDLTPLVGSAGNYFGYSNAEVDTLLAQMGTVKLESDIKAVSISLYEKVYEESPFAPICFTKKCIVSSAKIKYGVNPSISGYVRETELWGVK